MQEDGVTKWLCGRGENDQLRLGGQDTEAPRVALLDLADHRMGLWQPEPAGESRQIPAARKLKKRKRVAVAFIDDLVAYRSIERPHDITQQQCPRITLTETVDRQVRQPGEDVVPHASAR